MPASLHLDQMPLSYYFLFSQYSRKYKQFIFSCGNFYGSNFLSAKFLIKIETTRRKVVGACILAMIKFRTLHSNANSLVIFILTNIHIHTFILMKIVKVKFHILLLSDYFPFFMR